MQLLITPQPLDEYFANYGLARTPCVSEQGLHCWDVTQIAADALREFTAWLTEEREPFELVAVGEVQ